MPRFRLAREAQRDLRRISRYIAGFNVAAAHRLDALIRKTLAMLARQPLIGEERPELGEGVRQFHVKDYVIYYVPTSGSVRAIRVLHGARDQEAAFDADE